MGRRRNRGHNLLEMMLAVVLFSTVVVFLIGVWSTYARAIGKARSVLVATYLGEQLMENCIAAKYANIDLFAGAYPQTVTTRALLRGEEVLTEYVTSVAVMNQTADIKAVTVTVEWEEKTATNTEKRNLKFNTLISRNN